MPRRPSSKAPRRPADPGPRHRASREDSGRAGSGHHGAKPSGSHWLFGRHAVEAALANPARQVLALRLTEAAARSLEARATSRPAGRPSLEVVERRTLDELFGGEAVHQGWAAQVKPLEAPSLESLRTPPPDGSERRLVLALDQVSDPHNVGAVLRSAAVFGAEAVLVTERHAPVETAVLAKSASGGLEHVPLIPVVNLARALKTLKTYGFWILGLAAEGEAALGETAPPGEALVVVLGAEGSGLRRLTRERCDLLLRIPAKGPLDHLNVSNAAAVTLFALSVRSEGS